MSEVIETIAEKAEVKNMQMSLELKGKKYHFVFEEGSTLGEIYDGCYNILAGIVKIAQENVEKAAPKHVE